MKIPVLQTTTNWRLIDILLSSRDSQKWYCKYVKFEKRDFLSEWNVKPWCICVWIEKKNFKCHINITNTICEIIICIVKTRISLLSIPFEKEIKMMYSSKQIFWILYKHVISNFEHQPFFSIQLWMHIFIHFQTLYVLML